MSFKDLKKSRAERFQELSSKLAEMESGVTSKNQDDRFWYPAGDPKTGNGWAEIRFLPSAPNEALPWARVYKHEFKGPTGLRFSAMCSTTTDFEGKKLGETCAICDINRKLWNSDSEANKKIASKQKRKLTYYSNIYVIKDPENPENEGQVKIYRYGKKVFEMLNGIMNPEFPDIEPVNPFDMWGGCNLKLRFKMDAGFRNYDASTFGEPNSLLNGDDKKLEEVYNQLHPLSQFIDPALLMDEEELLARYRKVTEASDPIEKAPRKSAPEVETEEESIPWDTDGDDAATEDIMKQLEEVTAEDSSDKSFDEMFGELK